MRQGQAEWACFFLISFMIRGRGTAISLAPHSIFSDLLRPQGYLVHLPPLLADGLFGST